MFQAGPLSLGSRHWGHTRLWCGAVWFKGWTNRLGGTYRYLTNSSVLSHFTGGVGYREGLTARPGCCAPDTCSHRALHSLCADVTELSPRSVTQMSLPALPAGSQAECGHLTPPSVEPVWPCALPSFTDMSVNVPLAQGTNSSP